MTLAQSLHSPTRPSPASTTDHPTISQPYSTTTHNPHVNGTVIPPCSSWIATRRVQRGRGISVIYAHRVTTLGPIGWVVRRVTAMSRIGWVKRRGAGGVCRRVFHRVVSRQRRALAGRNIMLLTTRGCQADRGNSDGGCRRCTDVDEALSISMRCRIIVAMTSDNQSRRNPPQGHDDWACKSDCVWHAQRIDRQMLDTQSRFTISPPNRRQVLTPSLSGSTTTAPTQCPPRPATPGSARKTSEPT